MTMHKAKGLEAEVVFLYGGYSPSPNRGVRSYTEAGARVATAGPPRDATRSCELIKRERESEDQRLFYVALTRARRRLYLPFSGEASRATRRRRWRGCPRRPLEADRRLHPRQPAAARAACRRDPAAALRDPRRADRSARLGDGGRPRLTLGLVGWRPTSRRRRRRSRRQASRSRPRRHRRRPPRGRARAAAAAPGRPHPHLLQPHQAVRRRLPSADGDSRRDERCGRRSPRTISRRRARRGLRARSAGDACRSRRCAATDGFEAWAARDDVRALLEATLRRHGRDPRQLPAPPRAWPTPRSPRRCRSWAAFCPASPTPRARRARWSSCSPSPRRPAAPIAGTSRGSSTCCSSTRGASTSATGRPIASRAGTQAVVEAHVAKNYALQEQLYALALVRMLGIASEADYEARFGGTLYLFVRGLPARAPSAAAARASPSSPPGSVEIAGETRRARRRRERARATLAARLGRGAGRRRRRRGGALSGARGRRLAAATSPRAERRAFALLVLASCEARAEGATRLALQPAAGWRRGSRGWGRAEPIARRSRPGGSLAELASHPALEPLVGRLGDHRPFIVDGGCLYQERDLRLEERLADALAARIATALPPFEPVGSTGARAGGDGAANRRWTAAQSAAHRGRAGAAVDGRDRRARQREDRAHRRDRPRLAARGACRRRRSPSPRRPARRPTGSPRGSLRRRMLQAPAPSTLHRLLGFSARRSLHGGAFRHHENNRLPHAGGHRRRGVDGRSDAGRAARAGAASRRAPGAASATPISCRRSRPAASCAISGPSRSACPRATA